MAGYTATELYDLFNSRYFRGRLPKIPVRWVLPASTPKRSKHLLGATHFAHERIPGTRRHKKVPVYISLHPKIKNMGVIWVMTLLHEMVHVEQHYLPESQAHGRKFEARMRDLANKGAFRTLW